MNRWLATTLTLILTLTFTGCEVVEALLKVGFWAGVIIVVLIVILIWLLVKLFT